MNLNSTMIPCRYPSYYGNRNIWAQSGGGRATAKNSRAEFFSRSAAKTSPWGTLWNGYGPRSSSAFSDSPVKGKLTFLCHFLTLFYSYFDSWCKNDQGVHVCISRNSVHRVGDLIDSINDLHFKNLHWSKDSTGVGRMKINFQNITSVVVLSHTTSVLTEVMLCQLKYCYAMDVFVAKLFPWLEVPGATIPAFRHQYKWQAF